MPFKLKILFALICLLFLFNDIYSQSINLGFEFGIGQSKTRINTGGLDRIFKYDKEYPVRIQLNSIIEFVPKLSFLSVYSGLGYSQKGTEFIDLHYLSSPLALKLYIGKQSVKPYFGGGVFISLLLFKKDEYSEGYIDSYNTMDLGGFFNIGLTYEVNTKLRFFLDYKNFVSCYEVYSIAGGFQYVSRAHFLYIGIMINMYRHN
jgi:hypothetical protein